MNQNKVTVVIYCFFSDLEEALLLLPFSTVCEVLRMLPRLVSRSSGDTELVCKLAVFLLKIHHGPIVANNVLLSHLSQLFKVAFVKAEEVRVS